MLRQGRPELPRLWQPTCTCTINPRVLVPFGGGARNLGASGITESLVVSLRVLEVTVPTLLAVVQVSSVYSW